MARAIWKGTISFGLVNAPVAMYSAIDEQDLRFHMVHRKDMGPIGYQKVCKKEDKPVDADEIAKAYELDDGKLVLLEDEDFEAAETDAYHEIRILDFVPHEQIDPIYFERTYYLAPADRSAEHVYALLAEAMSASGLSGISSFIFREREQLGCLRTRDGVLMLEKMFFANEIRDAKEHRPSNQKLSRGELEMARELIDRMAGDFEPEKYKDTYTDTLRQAIEQKLEGKEIHVPAPGKPPKVVDLMEALQRSLEEGRRPPAKADGRRATARRAAAARRRSHLGGPGKHGRCIVLHRCFECRDVRQLFVFDPHELRGCFRGAHAHRSNRRDRLAVIAHERIRFVRLESGIAQLRDREDAIEYVHCPHAGIGLRRRRVDRFDPGVRHGAAHDAPIKHSGELDVVGVARRAGHLWDSIDTIDALADDAQLGIGRQLRRLPRRNGARHGAQRLAHNAGEDRAVLARIRAAHAGLRLLR